MLFPKVPGAYWQCSAILDGECHHHDILKKTVSLYCPLLPDMVKNTHESGTRA